VTYIALLRAVNLAGFNKVGMSDLRELAAALGGKNVRTLLQSGNLILESDVRTSGEVERLLESGARKTLALETEFFVRTAAEWKKLVAANPFPKDAKLDPGHLLVMCLKDAPSRQQVAALQAAIKGREIVRAVGPQAYIVYPDGVGRSRLTSAIIERHLGTRATGRNWNTVLKLQALTKAL